MNVRLLVATSAGALAALALVAPSAIAASAPSPHTVTSGSHSAHFLPTTLTTVTPAAALADTRKGSPPLLYHGGPIMTTEKSYAIYWNPGHLQSGAVSKIPATYKSLTTRWFKDANLTGVFKNNVQYTGTNGHPTSTSFGAAWVDTTPFPVGHCTNGATGANCLTDADIAATVLRNAASHGVAAGLDKMFFVYTPAGEGSCFDAACSKGSQAYVDYCAYHSFTGSGNNVVYANQPWPTQPASAGPPDCYFTPGTGTQTFPNSNTDADASISITSHEQNEAISDPLVNFQSGWYDAAGYENGDECAYQFGANTATGGGNTNVNGHPYEVQMEGSNQAHNCVISGPAGP